jgi:Mobilization protein NikA
MPADPGWRSQVIQVRCSPEEKNRYENLAYAAGVPLSELVRRLLDEGSHTETLARLAAGDRDGPSGAVPGEFDSQPTAAPAASPSFRPDPKRGSKP